MARARAHKPKKEKAQQEGHLKKQPEGGTADPRKEILNLQETAGNRAVSELIGDALPEHVQEVLWSPGQPLDPTTRAKMEARLGQDFDQVRIHKDTQAATSARKLDSRAYTLGQDIVFGEGQWTLWMPGNGVKR